MENSENVPLWQQKLSGKAAAFIAGILLGIAIMLAFMAATGVY